MEIAVTANQVLEWPYLLQNGPTDPYDSKRITQTTFVMSTRRLIGGAYAFFDDISNHMAEITHIKTFVNSIHYLK